MAEVFAGVNVRTNKRVALKWIRPALATTAEALARFKREALAAGRIHHPNVVTVFDAVEHNGATWLVMELLEGETLADILIRSKSLPPDAAIALLIPAMRGVAAAHAHGVVHRDLKPDNIFVCRAADGHRREAKVLDFGVSKLADEISNDQVSITNTGSLVGTPIYMAPEQVRGTRNADQRVDVYALGVVLYQMLSGRPPYQGEVYSALMVDIATTNPPTLRSLRPEIPLQLEEIVDRAMAREVGQRYPDVNTFIRALEEFVRADVGRPATAIWGGATEPIAPIAVPESLAEDGEHRTLKVFRLPGRNLGIAVAVAAITVLLGLGANMILESRSASEESAESGAAAVTPPVPPEVVPAPPPVAAEAQAQREAELPRGIEPPAAHGRAAAGGGAVSSGKRSSGGDAGRPRPKSLREARLGNPAARPEVTRPSLTPPQPSSTPASRAGRISIDDF
jgi:serine/threonine-protein kinase